MKRASEIITQIHTSAKDVDILPTGWAQVDEFLDGGFQRKEFIVIGAGTGIGKSYIAGQLFHNIARKGFKSAYYSLEIANEMVVARLLGGLSNVKPARIQTGNIDSYENDDLISAEGELLAYEEDMLFEDDLFELKDLIASVEKEKPDLVVIDFLQIVEVSGIPDEYTRITKVANELKKLAKRQNCCIIALSQLSNQLARDKAEKMHVAEFRGSGAIAHAAHLGFIIERGQQMQTLQEVNMFLKKNRRGSTGITFHLLFKGPGGAILEDKARANS